MQGGAAQVLPTEDDLQEVLLIKNDDFFIFFNPIVVFSSPTFLFLSLLFLWCVKF